MRRRHLLARIVLGACLMVAAGNGALAQEKVLRVGINTANVGHLDPHRAQATTDRALAGWMFDALVRFPPGSSDPARIEPDLAERWEISPPISSMASSTPV